MIDFLVSFVVFLVFSIFLIFEEVFGIFKSDLEIFFVWIFLDLFFGVLFFFFLGEIVAFLVISLFSSIFSSFKKIL
jgi:hypothetical protein